MTSLSLRIAPGAQPLPRPRPAAPAGERAGAAGLAAVPAPSPMAPARRRGGVIGTIAALHALLLLVLLNQHRAAATPAEPPPLFLSVVAPAAPRMEPTRTLPPPSASLPRPVELTLPAIAAEGAPAALVVQAPPAPAPAPETSAPEPVVVAQALAAPAPRTLPSSGVQYLVAPAPVYARASARLKESGKTVVRVFVDEAGMARDAQVAVSSGFARLDESALTAVRNARFKPFVENGRAVAGWVFIPIEFELPS